MFNFYFILLFFKLHSPNRFKLIYVQIEVTVSFMPQIVGEWVCAYMYIYAFLSLSISLDFFSILGNGMWVRWCGWNFWAHFGVFIAIFERFLSFLWFFFCNFRFFQSKVKFWMSFHLLQFDILLLHLSLTSHNKNYLPSQKKH